MNRPAKFPPALMFFLNIVKEVLSGLFLAIFIPFFILKCVREKRRKKSEQPRLVWGTDPLISNKYWSASLKQSGFGSTTLMSSFYSINNKEDFDLYFDDVIESYKRPWLPKFIIFRFRFYFIFLYCIANYDIYHISANGFVLKFTGLKRFEAHLLKYCGKKIIVMPYGADFYRYSRVYDPSLRHALLLSYPLGGKNEENINKDFNYWIKNADIFLPSFQIDTVGRWDILPFSAVIIDTVNWSGKVTYSDNNGSDGPVRIIHSPNHRGFKGTEFIIAAVEELKREGLLIDFILVEKKSNKTVKELMQNSDILVEQIIATAYALSGIEGMASGLAVISNLESEYYTRMFRRYSFLNECPILSGTPENIKETLRTLITNPGLRKDLGMAGRNYVEKYHSFKTSQYMFQKIYDRIWFNQDVDLMNMFNPLVKDSYNNQSARISHPLIENRIEVIRRPA